MTTTEAANSLGRPRVAPPPTFTELHWPAIAGSLALLTVYSFGYLVALLRQEFYQSGLFGQALLWNDPRGIYACLASYFLVVFCALVSAMRQQGVNTLLFLCPLLAVDALARQLHTPLVPAAHFLVVIGLCTLPFVRRMTNLPLVIILFLAQTFFHVVFFILRGDYQLSNSDLMMLSFVLTLCLFYALTEQPRSSNGVWLHLGICVIVAALPDLVFFLKEVQFNVQSGRLNPLNFSDGANTHGVMLGIAGLGCLLYAGRLSYRTLLGAAFLVTGAIVVFGGSRWQIASWMLAALVVLGWRSRLIFLGVVVAGFLALRAYYGDFEFFIRLFSRFDDAIFDRFAINSVALEIFKAEWAMGVGASGWLQLSQALIGRALPVHNVMLSEFVHGGVIVGVLNMMFHLSLLFLGIRAYFTGNTEAKIAAGAMMVFVLSQQSVFYWHYGVFAALALALRVAEQPLTASGPSALLKNWLQRTKSKNV